MTLPCRFLRPARPGHLLHHLERPLVGSEIGVVEQRVGAEYAHDAHMGEVEPLGNHLRADEYLALLLFEVGDNLLVGFAAAGGVEVHAGDGPSRKRAGNLLLDALGAEAVYGNGGLAAGRAAGGHLLLVAAVVAHEAVGQLVVGEAHVAAGAAGSPGTQAALHHGGKAPAVLEQYRLLAVVEGLFAGLFQLRREVAVVGHPAFAAQVAHVDGENAWQVDLLVSGEKLYQSVFAAAGVEVALDGRCGRAQQRFGPVHRSQYDGCVAGVVAWCRLLLLVAAFVLFVDNDKPQVAEGQEYRGAHAENDLQAAIVQQVVPYLHPFVVGKFGMVDGQLVAEDPLQPGGELGSECNFGHEVENLSSPFQHGIDEVDIDFGLSARRNAVQEYGVFGGKPFDDGIVGLLLYGRERVGGLGVQRVAREAARLFGIDLEDAFGRERTEYLGRYLRAFEQFFPRDFACRAPLHEAREFEIAHQQAQLFLGVFEFVEEGAQFLVLAGGDVREPYVTLGAGAVFGLQLFRDDDGILLHERAHGGQDMAQAACLFEFLYAHLGVLPQGVEQNGLPLFKQRGSIFDEIVVAGNLGFALDFQSRRYGRLEDVAHRAEVIVGNPFPETQLRPAQDRRTVEQGR